MVFGQYAEVYDTFYRQKSYAKECRYLEQIFRKYLSFKPVSILDLGCGTGNHMIPLLERGYNVTGIDRSAGMLATAQKKIKELNLNGHLVQSDLSKFQLCQKFDVIICMFSVIDYLTKTKDVVSTFKNVAKHLKPQGLFVFDFWQKEAVEKYYSPTKKRTFAGPKGMKVERASKTVLDKKRNLSKIFYTCSLKNGKVIKRFSETHTLRYFGIEEMKTLLEKGGLKAIHTHPFLNLSGQLRKNNWDVTIVARNI